jgi:hypothetical protein
MPTSQNRDMGTQSRSSCQAASPVWGSVWLLVGEDDFAMEKTREFWLRMGVIGSALLLSSGLAAFFG